MRQQNALTVPREAIHQDAEGQYVFRGGEWRIEAAKRKDIGIESDPGSGYQRPLRQCGDSRWARSICSL